MGKKVEPFHISIVKQLKDAEVKMSKNKSIGLFVSQFVTEVKTMSVTIASTEIDKSCLPELISELSTFYREFESEYQRDEDGCGSKRERASIKKAFDDVINDLSKRLAA